MGGVASKVGTAGIPTLRPDDARKEVSVGPFTLDLSSMELRRRGHKICVQEKPVQLLAILLERPGQLFSRSELRRRLWPANTFVDFEHSINTAVKKLREALGDDAAHPEFVETVSHHGYRLIAPVVAPESGKKRPRLVILSFESLNKVDIGFSKALTDALITQMGKRCTMLDIIAPPGMLHDAIAAKSRQEPFSDYLLSGSLLRCKEQIRITVRLVRNEDMCCIWCESYTRMHPENLAIQDEVSASIAQGVSELFSPTDYRWLAG